MSMPLNAPRGYVEHVALHVADIAWHIAFFRDVLAMTIRDVDGDPESPVQVWLHGGIQLIAAPHQPRVEGRLAHLGIMVTDLDAAIDAGLARPGVSHTDRGRNWLRLPDGLVVELLQASPGTVEQALAVDPRAGGTS